MPDGMIEEIGAALTEEIPHDPRDGHIVNRDLSECHILLNVDRPEIAVAFIGERDDQACPIPSKGMTSSELSTPAREVQPTRIRFWRTSTSLDRWPCGHQPQ